MRSICCLPVLLALLVNCADDGLERRDPKLMVKVYEDGQVYADYDNELLSINLGQVPVFATKWAIFHLSNPTQMVLDISKIEVVSSTGHKWGDAVWVPAEDLPNASRPFEHGGSPAPLKLDPFAEALLGVPYSPLEEGDHQITLTVFSNAANGAEIDIEVRGTGRFTGAPDISVQYNTYEGPMPEDCTDQDGDGESDACEIPKENELSFGNIGLGSVGTVQLTLRNSATCAVFSGVDACTLCSLTVDKNPGAYNIGLGFKEGTNEEGVFSFTGSTGTPFELPQRNIDCGNPGEIKLLLNFNAPEEQGDHRTVIVVESNDPDEPVIEIPVVAYARNAPLAVATLRAPDPLNPGAPYTEADSIRPLERVYLDGRASYDPRDPEDPSLISRYEWEVIEFPPGLNPNDFQPQGRDSALFSFWLPLAGDYTVKLTVWNNDGIQSGDTVESRVEFTAVPGSRLHVQLTWDDPTNDQDLHLLYVPETETLCEAPWDCYFSNKTPQWFTSDPEGEGPNPRLDIDDTNGLGPENINIDDPLPGTYRVVVHYWGDYEDSSPTRETIRIFLNGLQVAEYRRTLNEETMWLVGDITWTDQGTGFMTPYPSDTQGAVGTVTSFQRDDCGGWGF